MTSVPTSGDSAAPAAGPPSGSSAPPTGQGPRPGPPAAATGPASASDVAVRRVLERLDELDELELADQVAVYEDVHRSLHDALSQAAGESSQGRRG